LVRRGNDKHGRVKMQLANSKTHYGAGPQLLHWLTALFVICGWLLGTFLDDFPKGPIRSSALVVHMTLGQLVIVLLIARLFWRMANPPPPPERTRFGWLQQAAAAFIHYVMYALLVAVPFMGILVQLKRGNPLPLFGVWDITSPWPTDRALARTLLRVHEYLADTLLILAGVHAAAALMHHYIFEDRTLVRMLPAVSKPARRRGKVRSAPSTSP
jgi:cytochrome b561